MPDHRRRRVEFLAENRLQPVPGIDGPPTVRLWQHISGRRPRAGFRLAIEARGT